MRRTHVANPPSAPAHRALHDSVSRVPRGDGVPALPSSALSGVWRQLAGTRPHSELMRGRFVRPGGSTPQKWPCESGRQERETRDWHEPASRQNHSHSVMDCQEKNALDELVVERLPSRLIEG